MQICRAHAHWGRDNASKPETIIISLIILFVYAHKFMNGINIVYRIHIRNTVLSLCDARVLPPLMQTDTHTHAHGHWHNMFSGLALCVQ